MPAASAEVIENYLVENTEGRPICEIYGAIEALDVRPHEELCEIFSQGGSDLFRQRFPRSRGILLISRAGFSSDGAQALIQIGQQIGHCAGQGFCFLYVMTEAGWTKRDGMTTWVS
jgi:hypothetical protein